MCKGLKTITYQKLMLPSIRWDSVVNCVFVGRNSRTQIWKHTTEAMASDENFILQQSIWKVKMDLGYIIDEEWG